MFNRIDGNSSRNHSHSQNLSDSDNSSDDESKNQPEFFSRKRKRNEESTESRSNSLDRDSSNSADSDSDSISEHENHEKIDHTPPEVQIRDKKKHKSTHTPGSTTDTGNMPSECVQLMRAIANNDVETTRKLINATPGIVQMLHKTGADLLLRALDAGQIDIARFLVTAINIGLGNEDNAGNTALGIAIQKGFTGLAKLLVEKGAEINHQNKFNLTPLMMAADCGNTEIVQLLISHKAHIELQSQTSKTALMYAVNKGNVDCIAALIKAGSNINHKDIFQNSPLRLAIKAKNTLVAHMLIENNASVSDIISDGHTMLICAAESGHSEIVETLIEHKEKVDSQDKDGYTALMHAARMGNNECIKILLKHGATIDLRDRSGRSALINAAIEGKTEAVELLIASGANIELIDAGRGTALTHAAGANQTDVIDKLIAAGANINYQTEFGDTALIIAAETSNSAAIAALLKGKPQLELRDNNDMTALLVAASHDDISTADQLVIIELLIAAGADFDLSCEENSNILYKHIENNKFQIVNALIDHSAKLHPESKRTHFAHALHAAVRNQPANPLMIDTLLSAKDKTDDYQYYSPPEILLNWVKTFSCELLRSTITGTESKQYIISFNSQIAIETGLRRILLQPLISSLEKAALSYKSSNTSNAKITMKQLENMFYSVVLNIELFHEISNPDSLLCQSAYSKNDNCSSLEKHLTQEAALQAKQLIDYARRKSSRQHENLKSLVNNLTSEFSAEQLRKELQSAGLEPLLIDLLVNCWAGLEEKTITNFYKAVQDQLDSPDFLEKFEQTFDQNSNTAFFNQISLLQEILKNAANSTR